MYVDVVEELVEELEVELEDVEEDVDDATAVLFAEAAKAEAESREKGIDAWRKAAQKAKGYRTPRRALARLYMMEQRWNALVEVLKEEVELARYPEEKVDLLRQMVNIYRDRLNLDVMVINGLIQILQISPSDLDVMDQLAAQYEKMNRWTDLISVLKKKAEAAQSVSERVTVWSRIACLFVERFSNQAEAIKAYEQVMEFDPTNREALENLKKMYERRRDWDRLIGIYLREIEQLETDSERAARYLEVADLASTKLKRPQVSMELWSKVLDYDPQNLKALEELEVLYERSKEWDKLADVCEREANLIDDVQRKIQVYQKLGVLFTEKAQDEHRVRRGQQEPDRARGGDHQEHRAREGHLPDDVRHDAKGHHRNRAKQATRAGKEASDNPGEPAQARRGGAQAPRLRARFLRGDRAERFDHRTEVEGDTHSDDQEDAREDGRVRSQGDDRLPR